MEQSACDDSIKLPAALVFTEPPRATGALMPAMTPASCSATCLGEICDPAPRTGGGRPFAPDARAPGAGP